MTIEIILDIEEEQKAEDSKACTMTPALERMYKSMKKQFLEEYFVRMLEANLPAEKIAQVFEMSIEEVQEKIAQLQNLDQIEAGF